MARPSVCGDHQRGHSDLVDRRRGLGIGLASYRAGRLRTKGASLNRDEVYFRDTAHGLITWALGTLIGIMLVSSAAGQLARGGAILAIWRVVSMLIGALAATYAATIGGRHRDLR